MSRNKDPDLIEKKVNQLFKSGTAKDFNDLAMTMSKLGPRSNAEVAKCLVKFKVSDYKKYVTVHDKLLAAYSKVMVNAFIDNPNDNLPEMKRLLSVADPKTKEIIVENMKQQMLKGHYADTKIVAAINRVDKEDPLLKEVLSIQSKERTSKLPTTKRVKDMVFSKIRSDKSQDHKNLDRKNLDRKNLDKSPPKNTLDTQKAQLTECFNTIIHNTNQQYGRADQHFGSMIKDLLADNPKYKTTSMQYARGPTGDFLAKAYPYPPAVGNRDQLVIDTVMQYVGSTQKHPTNLSLTYELIAGINNLRVTLDRMKEAQLAYAQNPADLELAMGGYQEHYRQQLSHLISQAKNSKELYVQEMVPVFEKLEKMSDTSQASRRYNKK